RVLVPLPRDPFTLAAFRRRQKLVYDEFGRSAIFITPEDIVLAKLIAFRKTGSDKHLHDVRGVLTAQWGELDLEAIRRGARAAEMLDRLEELVKIAHRETEGLQ
ncbi:MAG: hypothetical protein U9R15_12455, partial [Chloroflexota bacterium]|nr:hypothetical protein [Chloroflexota bacterium]